MSKSADEIIKRFNELDDARKLEFLEKASFSEKPLDHIPRYSIPLGIKRPLTREDAY